MSVLNLDRLLRPGSVALIGASNTEGTVGNVVMKNLLTGSFQGPVFPVNPKYQTVCGVYAYQSIASLPFAPDMAVVCTPADTLPGIITELGEKGIRAAVVLSAVSRTGGEDSIESRMLRAARPYDLRVLGPNCIGLLVPGMGLNASFAHTGCEAGKLALVSQSGALCTSMLDWANAHGIGFSHFISLGDSADVDFGDLLDYLGSDHATSGVLLYIESIKHARKFMSAARATSRNKKVIVIKAGRYQAGARAATSHTGALAGDDEVFSAAVQRAGMLRVHSINQLFQAAETLAFARPVSGKRLLILTNGGGPGVLATDELIANKGELAGLSENTVTELDGILPAGWSRDNPVDIIGDADSGRYLRTLEILLEDRNHDAILVMLVPVALIDNEKVARAVTEKIRQVRRPVLTCWIGEEGVSKAREIFRDAGIPTYDTPEAAIRAFMQMVEYDENQRSLLETPASIPEEFRPDTDTAAGIIQQAISEKRELLSEPEAKSILVAYDIPVVETHIARDIDAVVQTAEEIGYPVALKILSPDISHKSDIGGVLLNIESGRLLAAAAEGMQSSIGKLKPAARLQGFTVQSMLDRPEAYELIVGVMSDPIFGPVILFGEGGTAVEIIADRAVALPPLNMALADGLISKTRISHLLSGFRNVHGIDIEALKLTLCKISQLIIDHPQITELDINPLLADRKGVVVLDARVVVTPTRRTGPERLAIRPYPRELESRVQLDGAEILIRPIKPEDEPQHHDFVRHLSHEDLYFRFFRAVDDLSHEQLARFTQIDYDREMAFIAVGHDEDGNPETLGVNRVVTDADNTEAEFAIIIRTDFHGKGLGSLLMNYVIDYCRSRGLKRITGTALLENRAMLSLAKRFSFEIRKNYQDNIAEMELVL